jgi:hypothetical protein
MLHWRKLLISIAAALTASGIACAQTAGTLQGYPNRPIRMLVSQAAGGATDVVARIYAARMTELLGQQLVADKRQNSGGAIAGEITVRAPADGYTLLVAAKGTIVVAPHLVKLTFDACKDLTPAVLIGNSPLGQGDQGGEDVAAENSYTIINIKYSLKTNTYCMTRDFESVVQRFITTGILTAHPSQPVKQKPMMQVTTA